MLRNGLYVIATPIGNLRDISPRAIDILQEAEIIACEDSRITKKLFSLLGITLKKQFIAYEDHSEEKKAQSLIDLIEEGNAVALVSDAGSPLISDPGYKLVHLCRKNDIYVTVIPGPCAVVCALQLSGLPTNRFMFAGFIPNKDKARMDLFAELKDIQTTLVFYETAPRLLKTLKQADSFFANRAVAVIREMTKMYEQTVNGTCIELLEYFSKNEPKGEFVIVVAPPEKKENNLQDIRQLLAERLQQTSLKTVVKEISQEFKLNKNDVYNMALEMKDEQL